MPYKRNDIVAMPLEDEEIVMRKQVDEMLRGMVSRYAGEPSNSLEAIAMHRAQAALAMQKIRELEAQRLQPHDWVLVQMIVIARATHQFHLWRTFPINSLPVEILQYIFTMAAWSPDASVTSKIRLTISAVCGHWRAVATNTPYLWSTISFTTRPPHNLPSLCIQRAKSLPLTLFIDQRDPKWSGDESEYRFGPEDMLATMGVIVSVIDRVRELLIMTDTWVVISAALQVLREIPAPPLLSRLELHRTGSPYVTFRRGVPPEELLAPIKIFGGAPLHSLRHICLNGIHIDWSLVPLRNLHIFELRRLAVEVLPPVKYFRAILAQSPYLHTLILHGACPQLSVPDGMNPIVLRRLLDLTVGELIPEYAEFTFSLFTAPHLRRLTLAKMIGEDYTPLVQSLTGRFPGVTVLTVNGLEVSNMHVILEWLKSMPNLRYLKVSCVSSEFWEALCSSISIPNGSDTEPTAPNVPVCPLLEDIELFRIDFVVIQNVIISRAEIGAPIKRLCISENGLGYLQDVEVQWLTESGMLRVVPTGGRPDLDERFILD